MNRMKSHALAGILVAAGAAVAIVAPVTASAQMRNECVSVEVPSAMELPDGSVHAAGLLTLCTTQRFSPVSLLLRVYVDRVPVGQVVGLSRWAEVYQGAEPKVLFRRDGSLRLRLVGFSWPGRSRTANHFLSVPGRAPSYTHAELTADWTAPRLDSPLVVLLARAN